MSIRIQTAMKLDLNFNIDDARLRASVSARTEAAIGLLEDIADKYEPATFASSLGAEDMVLTDLIAKHVPKIEIFTLDTGRLHAETYRLLQKVTEHYTLRVRVVCPQAEALEGMVAAHGINGFLNSVESRRACCQARKVEPLARALGGKRAWVTGLRRTQSLTRGDLPLQEHDSAHRLEKFNPLAEWQERDVWAYLRLHGVPYNELHDRGYPSIGCEPCTRAVAPGEDVRSGRWWWEDPAGKECGLHPAKRTPPSNREIS